MDNHLDYEGFEKDWKKRHKASLPRKVSVSGFAAWFWILFWLIVAGGAAVFSAAHTIPAAELTLFKDLPYRSALAVTAFVIVEFVIFGAAAKRQEIVWMKWLLAGSLLVALIGNTSSSVKAVGENGGDTLNQVAGVLLSVIAPFTALAAGEVSHLQLAQLAQKQKEANEDYQQQWKEVEAKINTAFTKQERELKEQSRPSAAVDLSVYSRQTAQTQSRPSAAVDLALDYLRSNPSAVDLPVRDLGAVAGVGKDSAAKARNIYLSENGNGNGHIN